MGVEFYPCDVCNKAVYEEDIHNYTLNGEDQTICDRCVTEALDGLVNEWWITDSSASWGLVIHQADGTAAAVPLKFNQLWHLDHKQLDQTYTYGVYFTEDSTLKDLKFYDAKEFKTACDDGKPLFMLTAAEETFSGLMETIMGECDPEPNEDDRLSQMSRFMAMGKTSWVTVPRADRLTAPLSEAHSLSKVLLEARVKVKKIEEELKVLKEQLGKAEKDVVDEERKLEYAHIRSQWVQKPMAAAVAAKPQSAAAAAAVSVAKSPIGGKRKREDD